MTTARVIDVSSWQHPAGAPIDWAAVKGDGYAGVIVKASQGVNYINPYWRADAAGAADAGLLVGAYHFAHPGQNDADAEANYALAAVSGVDLPLGLSLDMEDLGGRQAYEVAPWCETWLSVVGNVVKLVPFYTDDSLLALITGAPWGHPLWLADPSGTYTGPLRPWMVQTGTGPVPGITGPVDLDTFYGVRGTNPTPPAPEPAPPAPPAPAPEPPAPVPPPTHPPIEVTVNVPQLSVTTPGPGVVEPAVRALQATLLGKWGIAPGSTGMDGRYGPHTADAVRELQTRAAGAAGPVDGICGALTWQYLIDG